MVVRKKKKSTRFRGRMSHGWGSKKKHRGAGNRGGRGNAGRGKRSDHKKPTYAKEGRFLGQKGFTPRANKVTTMNVGDLQVRGERFVQEGKIEKKGDVYIVDIHKLGVDKLLGSGSIKIKVQLSGLCTPHAKEKIKKAGGEVLEQTAN